MNLIKFSIASFLLVLISCNTTTKTVNSISNEEIKMKEKNMISEGFLAGQISFSKNEGDCPITIKVEGENGVYYLDPIDLSEEFKNNGENVWFKFAGLRRMNRCDKASPISIIEIQKRN